MERLLPIEFDRVKKSLDKSQHDPQAMTKAELEDLCALVEWFDKNPDSQISALYCKVAEKLKARREFEVTSKQRIAESNNVRTGISVVSVGVATAAFQSTWQVTAMIQVGTFVAEVAFLYGQFHCSKISGWDAAYAIAVAAAGAVGRAVGRAVGGAVAGYLGFTGPVGAIVAFVFGCCPGMAANYLARKIMKEFFTEFAQKQARNASLKVLGLSPEADDWNVVRKKFHEQILVVHPDRPCNQGKHADKEGIKWVAIGLIEAFNLLKLDFEARGVNTQGGTLEDVLFDVDTTNARQTGEYKLHLSQA